MSYPYWEYFLAIESDLEITSRYVEVNTANFKTYSIEYARILLSACSEIDVIAKLLCTRINPNYTPVRGKRMTVDDYSNVIHSACPKWNDLKILVPRYGLDLTPWDNWTASKPPVWWTAYNKVKHQRDTHYSQANLENTLNAVAGLFGSVLYFYYKDLGNITFPLPKLLGMESEPTTLMLQAEYVVPDDPSTLSF